MFESPNQFVSILAWHRVVGQNLSFSAFFWLDETQEVFKYHSMRLGFLFKFPFQKKRQNAPSRSILKDDQTIPVVEAIEVFESPQNRDDEDNCLVSPRMSSQLDWGDLAKDEECSICCEKIETGSTGGSIVIRMSSCRHGFHLSCIRRWLHQSQKPLCPLCRSDQSKVSSRLKGPDK